MRFLPLSFIMAAAVLGCTGGFNEKRIEQDFRHRSIDLIGTIAYENETSHISSGGFVFSLNRNRHELKKYSINRDGSWHLAIKNAIPSGKGPGEMMQPAAITADASGRLLVTDSDMNSLVIYDLQLNATDTMPLGLNGTLGEGDGMIAAYGDGKAVLSQMNLQRSGKELALFDYRRGIRLSDFGRDVSIDLNRMETFIAATGKICSIGNSLFRLTYEPMLYLYEGTQLIHTIDPNDALRRYGIKLAMPGAASRRVNRKVSPKDGISTYDLLQNGAGGEVYLAITDLKRKRILFLRFDPAGNVVDKWRIESEYIDEDGYTSVFIYGNDYMALYGTKTEKTGLYMLF